MRVKFDGVSNALFAIACVVVIVVGGLQLRDRLTASTKSSQQSTSKPALSRPPVEAVGNVAIDIGQATVKSQRTPGIALVEFSDLQCPFCGQYTRNTYAQIERDFVDTGFVLYAVFNFSIEHTHPLALKAAESVECAGQQGRFWEMRDLLFRDQRALAPQELVIDARKLELRIDTFERCMMGTTLSRLRQQTDIAKSSGVESTPTFFIGRVESSTVHATTRILGAQPYETFALVLKSALAQR